MISENESLYNEIKRIIEKMGEFVKLEMILETSIKE